MLWPNVDVEAAERYQLNEVLGDPCGVIQVPVSRLLQNTIPTISIDAVQNSATWIATSTVKIAPCWLWMLSRLQTVG